jgi:hypothetical protein
MKPHILPRPVDHATFVSHCEVWPSVSDEQRFNVCIHCGHYGFERDANFDECFVEGCECFSSDPHRNDDLCIEHMISSWSETLCQSLGTCYDLDREKWFTRHCQDQLFITITVKRKYSQIACGFYDALADEGQLELIDLADSSTVVTAFDVAITENFTLPSALSVRFRLKLKYVGAVEDYSYALADSAKVTCIHISSNRTRAATSASQLPSHEIEENEGISIPF